MIIVACLTYRKIKCIRNHIRPTTQGIDLMNSLIQRRHRDLLVLVSAEVIVYLISTVFSALMFHTYIFSLASFRKDFQQFLMVSYRKMKKQIVRQPVRRIHSVVQQYETSV